MKDKLFVGASKGVEFQMASLGNGKSLGIVFMILLLVTIVPVRVAGQATPAGTLWVTYVNTGQ
jgi:hypothetical protein